jgi:uroporphyrinogen decarboxylase
MNSRERVLTALSRQGLPDRVPLQFDLCRVLLDSFGEKHGIPVHFTTAYFEDVTYRLSANELRVAKVFREATSTLWMRMAMPQMNSI